MGEITDNVSIKRSLNYKEVLECCCVRFLYTLAMLTAESSESFFFYSSLQPKLIAYLVSSFFSLFNIFNREMKLQKKEYII